MQSQISTSMPAYQDVYTDINSLAKLKQQANENPQQGLKAVAKQFEALFMQMVLKSMRDASFGDPIFDSNQSEFYRDMFDKQLAINLSNDRGMGLAEALERQLRGSIHSLQPQAPVLPMAEPQRQEAVASVNMKMNSALDTETGPVVSQPMPQLIKSSPVAIDEVEDNEYMLETNLSSVQQTTQKTVNDPELTMPDLSVITISTRKNIAPAVKEQESLPAYFAEPEEFVQTLRPFAEEAARKLGVSADVLIAQAALETGWGKHVSQHVDGSSSYNLFNIKAGNGWEGDRVAINTLEYRGGIARRERAAFRAYDSYAESFNDYVDFIRSRPRYQEALNQASDPESYVKELQAAGYATDPRYADKIINIMQRPLVRDSTYTTAEASQHVG